MNATCLTGGSFTFRSILHGRDLLREGVVWRIGNGESINVHHDNWIPRRGCLKPLGQQYVQMLTQVSDLLTEHGTEWDFNKLDVMFTADDAADIKQIAIGGPNRSDYLAWNFTKNGQFSVRSAYHLRMSMNGLKSGRPGPSASLMQHKVWLALWRTNVPNKAKIHTWRLMRNGLAVGSELHRRRIKPGVFCAACGREETCYHRFWTCPHSALFWKLLCAEKGAPVHHHWMVPTMRYLLPGCKGGYLMLVMMRGRQ